jgi:hypothetical protein
MIRLNISPEQLQRAKEMYEFNALKNSVTEGKSNIYGAIGEVMVYDYFKDTFDVELENTFDYDLLINGKRIEVKTKKTSNIVVNEEYNVNIFATSIKQMCDYYFFTIVTDDFKVCYLLGYLRRFDFYKIATFAKKGEPDGPNFNFRADSYSVKIKDLIKFQ